MQNRRVESWRKKLVKQYFLGGFVVIRNVIFFSVSKKCSIKYLDYSLKTWNWNWVCPEISQFAEIRNKMTRCSRI